MKRTTTEEQRPHEGELHSASEPVSAAANKLLFAVADAIREADPRAVALATRRSFVEGVVARLPEMKGIERERFVARALVTTKIAEALVVVASHDPHHPFVKLKDCRAYRSARKILDTYRLLTDTEQVSALGEMMIAEAVALGMIPSRVQQSGSER